MTVLFRSNDERILLILLSVIGVLLTATTIRGSFIIDEVNYAVTVIGLRHGTLAVPGTENLGPSKELFFFDPESENRAATSAPVVSLAPALYAPIALPFSLAGWRGLAFLNTLSFLCAAAFVYFFTRRIAADPATSWVAISLFVLGGYEFEYAQGVWPHMLSVALCAGALLLASDVWQHSSARSAVWAGVLFGIACGIREQNVFLAICLGGTFLVVGSRKLLSAASYAGGVAIPMMVSSTINYFKLGVWFPTPKAAAYSGMVSASVPAASWLEPLKVFLVKVVDFSTFGLFRDPTVFVDYSRDPSTGAFLVGGVVKKALLQSSPWFALALVVALLVWFTKRVSSDRARSSVKALAFLLLPTLAIFSAAGFRTDGLSFNQRYLLELLPIASILVALSLDGLRLSFLETFAGVLFAGLMFAVTLMIPGRAGLQIATLKVPLVLGLFLILLWTFRGHPSARRFLGVALGV
ncbi:MAG TPA: hypothetical protein VMM37_02180, partial [Bacteroidota bacterium]|nr:hypothetical protein [Bacteroidota bacterium]